MNEILCRWDEEGLHYALLAGYERLPELTTDVDIAVSESDFEAAVGTASSVALERGYRLVQVLWYDLRRCTAFIYWREGNGVQLDLECDDHGLGRLGSARHDMLMASTGSQEAVYRARYVLRKRIRKGILEPRHLETLHAAIHVLEQTNGEATPLALRYARRAARMADSRLMNRQFRHVHRLLRMGDFLSRPGITLRIPSWRLVRCVARVRQRTGAVVDITSHGEHEFQLVGDLIAARYALAFHRVIRLQSGSSRVRNYIKEFVALRSKTLVLRWRKAPDQSRQFLSRPSVTVDAQQIALLMTGRFDDQLLPTESAKRWLLRQSGSTHSD